MGERRDGTTWLVLGDWGRGGSAEQRAVAAAMAAVAGEYRLAGVLTTGDNFYDDGVAGDDDPHWRESFADVYADPRLDVPWTVCVGNHDWRGSLPAQIARSLRDRRWRLPAPYHACRPRADLELVVLDTTSLLRRYGPGGDDETPGVGAEPPERQLAWLERTLARSPAPWRVVVGHHPILSGSPHHGGEAELDRALRPLLEEHGVPLYLAGHEHDLQHLVQGDVHYVVSGAGAEARPTGIEPRTVFAAGTPGFAALTVTPEHLRVRLYDAEPRLLHEAEIRAPRPATARSGR